MRTAGNLVQADQHGLAGLPLGGVVVDEVLGDAVEPPLAGEDPVVLAQQPAHLAFLVRVESVCSSTSAMRRLRSGVARPSLSPRLS